MTGPADAAALGPFVLRVLDLIGRADLHDDLYWRTDGDYAPVTFFIHCSDLFSWATADAEPLTPDTLPAFEKAIADVQAASGSSLWGPSLYAARQRRQRPMRRAYPGHEPLHGLFDACGPAPAEVAGGPQ